MSRKWHGPYNYDEALVNRLAKLDTVAGFNQWATLKYQSAWPQIFAKPDSAYCEDEMTTEQARDLSCCRSSVS